MITPPGVETILKKMPGLAASPGKEAEAD